VYYIKRELCSIFYIILIIIYSACCYSLYLSLLFSKHFFYYSSVGHFYQASLFGKGKGPKFGEAILYL